MEFEIKNGVLERCIPEQDETSVTVPDSVTQIGTYAFAECISLERALELIQQQNENRR